MIQRKILLFIVCLFAGLLNARAIEVETVQAGDLSSLVTDCKATELIIKGDIDARDLKFISEEMTALSLLDLSKANIKALKADKPCFGEALEYAENVLPDYCFFAKDYETVQLPNGLVEIGEGSFAACKKLSSVSLPVSLKVIGKYAFSACDAISGVVLGSNLNVVAEGAFMRCKSLKIADLNALSAECSLGNMIFSDCIALEVVKLGENVKNLPIRAFAGCRALATIEFADVTAIESIGEEAFASTALNGFNFERCAKLEKIEDWAFAETRMTSVALPEGVTAVGEGAFFENESVAEVLLPSTLEEIGSVAFAGNKNLKEKKVEAKQVPTLGELVWHGVAQGDVKVTVPEESVEIYRATEQWCEFNIVGDATTIEESSSIKNLKAYISKGHLIVKASEEIAYVEVHELNGIKITSLSPMAMYVDVDLTGAEANVYLATIALKSGKTKIIKLIRQ